MKAKRLSVYLSLLTFAQVILVGSGGALVTELLKDSPNSYHLQFFQFCTEMAGVGTFGLYVKLFADTNHLKKKWK